MSTPGPSERNSFSSKRNFLKALGPTGFFPGNKNVFSIPPQAVVPGILERTAGQGSDSIAGEERRAQCNSNPVRSGSSTQPALEVLLQKAPESS